MTPDLEIGRKLARLSNLQTDISHSRSRHCSDDGARAAAAASHHVLVATNCKRRCRGKRESRTMVSVNTKGNPKNVRGFNVARTVSMVMTLGIIAGLATLSK